MPDLKDVKQELADALTEAGAMPQWELVVTAQFLEQPTTLRLRIPGGWLYNHGAAIVFVPYMASDEDVEAAEENADEWFARAVAAEAERDAARKQIHRLEEENGRMRGQTELLQAERDRAQKGYEREHSMRHQSNQALVQAANERDTARAQLAGVQQEHDACTEKLVRIEGELQREQLGREQAERRCEDLRGERETWQRKYAEQRRQAEDWEAEACKARQERDAARAAADEWSAIARDVSNSAAAATAHPSHVGQRPTQVGQASFVMRGCRLPEGHEGPCSIR